MLNIDEKCTGCGACSVVCPKGCIQMESDLEGFRYPVIDNVKCIHCQLCEQSCPVTNKVDVSTKTIALAAKNKVEDVRLQSSSGGVFSALAEKVLAEGGVVCAAKYTEDFSVIHNIFESTEEISEYRGAKYTQSKVEHCFEELKRILEDNRYVLFVGTPCQVAALSAYLKKEYPKLFLVDMICHGVPSPVVWKGYLDERRNVDANGSPIKKVNLRSKVTGWSNYSYSVEINYENGNIYSVRQNQDNFMKGFISNLYLRKSCSHCEFKGTERCSDITLADYWGIWIQDSEFDDNKGISALLIHTEKGQGMWEKIKEEFMLKKVSKEDIVQYNPSAIECSTENSKRKEFFNKINQGDSVIETIEMCLERKENYRESKIKRFIKRIIS